MIKRMQSYLLTPLDTLFFRGGEPFNAGEDHHLSSQFPPSPRTFQGIVRSRALEDAGQGYERETVERLVGWGDDLKESVRGPFLFYNDEIFLPIPLCFVRGKGGRSVNNKLMKVEACTESEIMSDAPCALPVKKGIDAPQPLGGLIDWSRMRRLLWEDQRDFNEYEVEEDAEIWQEEVRTGIGFDRVRRTARSSFLYSIGHIRLKETAALWFQSGWEIKEGVYQVGGEGRLASFHSIDIEPDLRIPDDIALKIAAQKRFWLILVQPAFLSCGMPGFLSSSGKGEIVEGIEVELETMVLGRPHYIGGFDVALKRPRNMRPYVPAGSAYLLKITETTKGEEEIADTLKTLHNSCFLGDEDEQKMGFGHVMIGIYGG